MEKQIIITDQDRTLTKEYDLYEMYNGFLMDIDDGTSPDDDLDLVENIRDNYSDIFEAIPSGNYTLEEFEELATNFLDGEDDENDENDEDDEEEEN